MVHSSAVLHRVRRVAAKSIILGRRVVSELTQKSPVEKLMGQLPQVETAANLAGKVVVITGSTRGIGFAVAKAFAGRGARIVINGRRSAAVDEAVEQLTKENRSVAGVVADISTAEGAARLVAETVEKYEGLDILINNAFILGPLTEAWKLPISDFQAAVRTNLTGPVLCMQEAVRWLLAQGRGGRIINVSTGATETTVPKFMAYSVTKAALEVATRHFAADLPDAQVVITGIILPGVQTEWKRAADWASTELQPPVESIIPAFEHAATAPAGVLHGRIFSAARFNENAAGEGRLAGLPSVRRRILYPELSVGGRTVERDPRSFALLDRAENQHGTSPRALDAIGKSLTEHPPAFYPDERLTALTQALADEHGLKPENFAAGPGSWELINRIVAMLVKPAEEVVSNSPGWFGFNAVCQRQGVNQIRVPFNLGENSHRPSHSLDRIRRVITPRTRLVYLISPSNPEGVTLQNDEVQEFLADIPPELPIIIDEAYVEFASDPDMVDVQALVREGQRTIIGLRTFSKFYALGGMRVGYAYAPADVAALLRDQEFIFQVSHVAMVAAVAALSDRDHRQRVLAAFRRAKEQMDRGLTEIGIPFIRGEAPYVLAKSPRHFDSFIEALVGRGIVVPPYHFYGDQMVMLPIGTQAQNETILETLRQHM